MDFKRITTSFVIVVFVVLGGIGGCMFGIPQYNVWQQQKEGEAELAKAEQNRQIKVQEAQATKDSAQLLADSEIIKANGVAKANQIIGDSLKNNEPYLQFKFIETLNDTKNQIIYVPTESGMPVMEANRYSINNANNNK